MSCGSLVFQPKSANRSFFDRLDSMKVVSSSRKFKSNKEMVFGFSHQALICFLLSVAILSPEETPRINYLEFCRKFNVSVLVVRNSQNDCGTTFYHFLGFHN